MFRKKRIGSQAFTGKVIVLAMLCLSLCVYAQEDTEGTTLEFSDKQKMEDSARKALQESGMEQMDKAEPGNFYVPPSVTKSEDIAGGSVKSAADLMAKPVFQRTVNVESKDAPLQDVIRLVAKQTGINIIMNEKVVQGKKVTVSFKDVSLGVALDVILKTNNLGYVLEPGNILRVVPREMVQDKPVEMETKLFTVNWVPVGELKATLEDFKSDNGEIRDHKGSNSIIITDTPPNIRVFENLIERLDKPQRQVMIESRIANIRVTAFQEFGIDWNVITQGDYYELAPEAASLFTNSGWWVAKELITDGNGGDGGDDGGGGGGGGAIGDGALASSGYRSTSFDLDNIATIGKTEKGLDVRVGKVANIFGEEMGIEAGLRALEDRGEAVILANPRVVTLNNVSANIDLTQDNPYFEAIEKEGGQLRYSAKFKESGIRLVVTPYITQNGYIRMQLEPEQKIITGTVREFGGSVPIISTRKAVTNVIVEDEDTVCLGGLRQHNDIGSVSGVPWFAHIPLIGWLFKDTTTDINKDELVIFVTPHIIKNPELNEKEKFQYDWIDNVWNLPEEFLEDHPVIPEDYKDIEKDMYPNKITRQRIESD